MRASTKKLIEALKQEKQTPGIQRIINRTEKDYYHDFFGESVFNVTQLMYDLATSGASKEIKQRVINGDFAATKEEADEWAQSPEGQEISKLFMEGK